MYLNIGFPSYEWSYRIRHSRQPASLQVVLTKSGVVE